MWFIKRLPLCIYIHVYICYVRLFQGLQENISLKHLSLKGSFIGDSNVAGLIALNNKIKILREDCCN